MKTNIPENLTAGDVIMSTGIFTSRTEATKAVKNKGVKINGETVEDMKEKIEHGDFLNLAFAFPSFARDCVERNSLDTLIVRFGKNRWAVVRVNNSVVVEMSE